MPTKDTLKTRRDLKVGGKTYAYYSLEAAAAEIGDVSRLPYSMKVLLENLLRFEDGSSVTVDDIRAIGQWLKDKRSDREIAYRPARVLMQDFTGVPAVVDLAAMRDATAHLGADPRRINPQVPVDLVIDHSVMVDFFGSANAFEKNVDMEYQRNGERYTFLRWGQEAFDNFRVVPPGTGICHQVNLEYLAQTVWTREEREGGRRVTYAFPDTLVGTDSHTTMINGLGVLGWGVGGIEAEAAMLGQPISMLIPQVVGFRLTGSLAEGATATDLVLRVTEVLRQRGVVGKFVEFFGPGLETLPLADRATIANMAPEYGATCGIFPVDRVALGYLAFTGRPKERVALAEAYFREQGLFHTADSPEAEYSDTLELDLATVEASLAGPRRPQDRVPLSQVPSSFRAAIDQLVKPGGGNAAKRNPLEQVRRWESEGGDEESVAVAEPRVEEGRVHLLLEGREVELTHGSVVIAAITSCTNTSNPSVMVAAGLVARNAVAKGLDVKPWVKTSLAPGSKVVTDYLEDSELIDDLEALKFHLVGYGCTTCIGNSGPLPTAVADAIHAGNLVCASVLSGNRNFEGRINPDVRANYLASPPLVVAYALAGRIDLDMYEEPLGTGKDGEPVYLKDIWPSRAEVREVVERSVRSEMFEKQYADVYTGDETWRALPVPEGDTFAWSEESTYVKHPPYFEGMGREPEPVRDISGARVLALLGDSITTDHISPAGAIKADSPAGEYLVERGVPPREFNSYGSRRGNHEVMMRGTFANVRLRNLLTPEIEGGYTLHLPSGEPMSIFGAAMKYRDEGVPLVILAGREYGTGSSRDWAAKGPALLGVKAVIAASYERIHRSNLVGMGVAPLELIEGQTAESLGLTGRESFAIEGLAAGVENGFADGREVTVRATPDEGDDGAAKEFRVRVRLDTPQEVEYYRHGGILQYVLRQLLAA